MSHVVRRDQGRSGRLRDKEGYSGYSLKQIKIIDLGRTSSRKQSNSIHTVNRNFFLKYSIMNPTFKMESGRFLLT